MKQALLKTPTHLRKMYPEIFIDVVVLLLPIVFAEMTPEVRLPQMQQQSVVIHKPVVAELTLRMTTV